MSTNENLTMSVQEKLSEVEVQTEQQTEQQTEKNVNLTLGILNDVRNVFQIAVRRGAFLPNELSFVGRIYDNFNASVDTLNRQIEANNIKDTPPEPN